MPENYRSEEYISFEEEQKKKKKKNNFLLHIGLFLITFITSTIAGAEWILGPLAGMDIKALVLGLPYAISILFIITSHEFGHYFAARRHKVDATLPYYIPFPAIPGFLNFGTMGAVIRTKSPIYTKKAMFDIGVAGPIAGFIACLIVLLYGFMNVPNVDYLLAIHPDFFEPKTANNGSLYLEFGNTFLFSFFKMIFVQKGQFFPPMSEIYHYPFLCVGWFGLFITAMNMIPVGQLDGGHIAYAMFGEKNHYKISVVFFSFLFIYGVLGVVDLFVLQWGFGWTGWLFWSLILFFIIKLKHPPIPDNTELDPRRKFLGYLSFFIFVISFSPVPFGVSL